jgi:WD40 repeat protein
VKHNNTVYSVVFSPDGQTLASGDGLGQIILWNVPDKKKIKPLELHIKPI